MNLKIFRSFKSILALRQEIDAQVIILGKGAEKCAQFAAWSL
jgi:hypothetical protein